MGQGQPPLSYNPPPDVPTCHLQRAKGGGMSCPPRLLAAYAQLNPEVGVPAIQLVWLETSREELLDIYLEVYKLHRPSWKRCPLPSQVTHRKKKRLPMPKCSLATKISTHPKSEDLTEKGKLQCIEVLTGCTKCTGKLCQLLQP